MSVETVRSWCVRHERGLPGGLPSHHMGERPAAEAGRRDRRVAREDLEAFIRSRRVEQRQEHRANEREGIRHKFRQARRAVSGTKRQWV